MTRAGRARVLALAGVIGSASLGGVLVAGTPVAHAAATGSTYFSATTTASALHVAFTQSPADSIVTGTLVNDGIGYATSGFATGGSSEAVASPLYPGSLVVGGPGLLCADLLMCPFTPPAYPLLADASYPRTPNAHVAASTPTTRLGGLLTVTPSDAIAHARVDGNTGTTATGAVSLLAGTPLALSIGASTATTTVSTRAAGMSVHVASSVSDLKIGPLLHIGAIHTSDTLTLSRGHRPLDHPHVAIGSVTVAGEPATITASGIHVAGHKLGSLVTKLIRGGISVRTLGVDRTDHTDSARSSAGGLEIVFSVPITKSVYVPNPLSSLPGLDEIPGVNLQGTYIGEVQLGGAGAAAALRHQADSSLPAPASTTGKGAVHPSAPTSTTAPSQPGAVGAATSPATAPGGSPVVAATPATTGTRLVGLSRDDLMTIYLVLAFGTMTIFLGWRGSVALRRTPRSTPRTRPTGRHP